MEGSTVSPPPTSPTKGDDLCDIDVTDTAIDTVTLLICLCGLAGNGAVLCLLCRKPSTFYIINLAFADFTFLHFTLPSTLLYLLEDVSCSTITPLMFQRALFLLLLFSYNLGLYLLTALSIGRCISVLCPLWYRWHWPQHLSWLVCALLWALSVTFIVTVSYLCLAHEPEHCQLSLISMYALNLFLFAPAMVISSTILFIKVKCGSQQQQSKRLDIIFFLTVLFFLLFALPLSLCNFLQQLSYSPVSSQVVFLLTCINSTIRPFTCFLAGRCWRHRSVRSLQLSLQRLFEEPEENTACSNDAAVDTALPAC